MTPPPRGQQGRGAVGLVAGLALLSLLLSAAASVQGSHKRRAVEAASFGLASTMRRMSVEARSDGLSRAVVFPQTGRDEPIRLATDVTGDGVSRAGLANGSDRASRPFTLSIDHPGVRIARLARPGIPDLPPSSRLLDPNGPGVRFGSVRMAVFTPEGHATPGSLFITDGSDGMCALVVNGATARIRVFCLDASRRAWRLR